MIPYLLCCLLACVLCVTSRLLACLQLLSAKTYPTFNGSIVDGIKQIFEDLAISPKAFQVRTETGDL